MIVERLADIGRKMGQLPPLLSLRLLSDQNVFPPTSVHLLDSVVGQLPKSVA
jgi:hypothetical protein